MPLGLRLPPLFARSKTASSSASSEPDSLAATTAASSTIISNTPSLSDLKKNNSSILGRRRGRSKASSERVAIERRRSSGSPSVTISQPGAVEDSQLGSVGEEREDTDGANNQAIDIPCRPALVVQEATPPATEQSIPTLRPLTVPRSPLGLDASRERPTSSDGISVGRKSSCASPRHVSRRPSVVDSANAVVMMQPRQTMTRKIWVRRPGASATLVQIREDDLVDDVRDMILRKYANSLGRTFDAPDMILRIVARGEPANHKERVLSPEEEIWQAIDMTYPGGQSVDEALVIDVPTRRTPKPSPKVYHNVHHYQHMEDYRPVESGTDYFPPMPPVAAPMTLGNNLHHAGLGDQQQRSMTVLTTGQLPPLPSPGSTRRAGHRPKPYRGHTSSPTIIQHNPPAGIPLSTIPANMMLHRQSTRPRVDSSASETHRPVNGLPPPPAPPLPTPPAPEAPPTNKIHGSTPPTPSTAIAGMNSNRVPRPKKPRRPTPEKSFGRPRRDRRGSHEAPAHIGVPSISNMLESIVPPINVLIVEDNSINLSVLERLMKRMKVRWDSAVNGQIAVDKWRKGGYHLILMDIQMPVMNGLQATREIRRLEKVNGIGVFSSSAPSSPEEIRKKIGAHSGTDTDGETNDTDVTEVPVKRDPAADKLTITESIFKSPIIIVALTASSLQSDRHEALAAGCNDFLTKPVNPDWLKRKISEWGAMQALIDYDGWKRWRDINEKEEAGKTEEQKQKEREQDEKSKRTAAKMAILQEKQAQKKRDEEEQKRKAATASNRLSVDASSSSLSNGSVQANGS